MRFRWDSRRFRQESSLERQFIFPRGIFMDPELDVVRQINKLAGQVRPVDFMMDLITRYGHWAFLIYGMLLWFAPGKNQKRRRESCVAAFLAVCLCSVISLAVGKLWHRGRPFTRDRQIWNFTGHKANASFPSNHAMNGAAVAFQLLRDRMPGCRWMACLAGLLAFSRLFAGMHYPSDILGGGAIAAAVHGVLNKPFAAAFIKKLTGALSLLSDSILYIGKSR
jgi:undecaprenyl-diphosphatase